MLLWFIFLTTDEICHVALSGAEEAFIDSTVSEEILH